MELFSKNFTVESEVKSSPERHLIVACLSRALQDVYEPNQSINSRSWFFDNSTEPFSFIWCMQSLEMEAMIERVRNMIFNNEVFSIDGKGHHKNRNKNRAHWYVQTPDTPLKECKVCHKILPETSFYVDKQIYRYPYCMECQKAYVYNRHIAKKRATLLYGKRLSRQPELRQPQ